MLAKSGQDPSSLPHLRRCALQCSLRVACCAGSFDSAVTHATGLLAANRSPRDKSASLYIPRD